MTNAQIIVLFAILILLSGLFQGLGIFAFVDFMLALVIGHATMLVADACIDTYQQWKHRNITNYRQVLDEYWNA